MSSNFGVLYDARIGGFTVDLAAFRSIFDIDRTDYTLISADAAGHASATTFRNPDRTKRSDSAEARVGRQFEAGGISHLATVSLRGRPYHRRSHLQPRHPSRHLRLARATIRRTEWKLPGQGLAARTRSSRSPPRRVMGSRGATVSSSASPCTGRATTRKYCPSPACEPKVSARPRSTTLRPSSVSRTARPCSAAG